MIRRAGCVALTVVTLAGLFWWLAFTLTAGAQTTSTTTGPTTTIDRPDNPDDLQPDAPTGIIPDQQYGGGASAPPSHYDLGWASGDGTVGFGPLKVKTGIAFSPVGLATAGIYAIDNAALNVAFALTAKVLNFGIIPILAGPVNIIGRALSTNLLGSPFLPVRALVIIACGIQCLRKARDGTAVARNAAVSSVLLLVAAGALSISPGSVFELGANFARQTSILVMDTVAERHPQPGEQLGDAYYGALQTTLIHQPYERLNWGGHPVGPCAAAEQSILRDGPWGDSDEPRTRMVKAGCPRMAAFNASASWSRLTGVIALTLVVHAIAWGLILFSLVVVVSVVGLAVTCAVGPIALTLAAPAGKMRILASKWAGSFIGRSLKVVAYTAITGGFLACVGALAAAPDDTVSGGMRWFYLVSFVAMFGVALWKVRKLPDWISTTLSSNSEPRPVGKVIADVHHSVKDTTQAARVAAAQSQAVRAGAPVRDSVRNTGQAAGSAARSWAGTAARVGTGGSRRRP